MPQSNATIGLGIEERIAVVAGHLNVFHAQLVLFVAEALENGEWHGDRIHTPAQWLAWRAGVSPERAQQIVAVATSLSLRQNDVISSSARHPMSPQA